MIEQVFESLLKPISDILGFLLMGGRLPYFGDFAIAPFGFPPLVLWLFAGGIFFTLKLRFVNLRLFWHGIVCVTGKYNKPDDPGSVTHFQALSTAISATVGLGNIGGVAIAVVLGGPGAVIWMVIAAFFGMSTKFAEVTLGQLYRHISHDGEAYGGAFYYLKEGLSELGRPKFGKFLACTFAVCCIGGAIGGGILFQSNQAVLLISDSFSSLQSHKVLISAVFAIIGGLVLVGGIKRIAIFAETVVPLMAIIYVTACLVVLYVNRDQIVPAIGIMFSSAFSGSAVGGGVVGAILQGVRRSAFSNEAGLGSAPIAHATAKTSEPVREGCVALLEPFIDTIVICFLTGIMVTVTGAYLDVDGSVGGVLVTAKAFATVIDWFPMVLSVA
ncbi:MAG: AGCS family alanine or glycine:cation symporter, partial [Candidatus Marinamargulisbacteria bacterium]